MPTLLSPLSFSGLSVRNRIAMPPMWSGKATAAGHVTDAIVQYHRVRAAAGTGLIIVEHAFVHPQGQHSSTQLGVYDDGCTPGLARLAAAIKADGAVACLQISHAGARSSWRVTGLPVLAPSAVLTTREAQPDPPCGATRQDIDGIIGAFAAAAARAQRAGFDAVEVHAAHGFLLSQFLSPLANHRDDAYGVDHEGRSRLVLEVLAAARAATQSSFPVFVRLGAHDERPGGLTLEPACWTAERLVEGGAALLDISGGLWGSDDPGRGPGYFVDYAEAIKGVVDVPVLVAGGITDPAMADAIVRSGRADLVGIGRAMLDDAEWTRKAVAALGQA